MNTLQINHTNTLSAFSSLSFSNKATHRLTIESALLAIKNGFLQTPNGLFNLAFKVNQARKAGKGSDVYTTNKTKHIPAISWAADFTGSRKKDGDFTFSGAIYFDVDEFLPNQTLQQAKEDIASIPCVKAVWKSLSGKGLGGIIYADGYDVGYFYKMQELLRDKKYIIDIAVKDLESRLNVLTYDADIIIKSDADVKVLTEVAERPSELASVSNNNIKNNNLKVTLNSRSHISLKDGSDAHRRAYAYASKGLRYIQGQRNAFIVKYAGMTNQFGLSFNDMSKEILTVHPDFDLNRAEDIYKRYNSQFGTLVIDSKPASLSNNNIEKLNLKVTQYLGDILNQSYLGKYIIAPTGTGKSYFVGKTLKGKRIMVVPTQTLSSEFAAKYNGKEFNEFSKDVCNNDDLIFVTYASFATLCEYVDISRYNVILDEVHLFSTGSSRSFMYNQLASTLKILKRRKQLSTTLLTATPVKSSDDFFDSFDIVKVTQDVTKHKAWTTIRTFDKLKTLRSVFERASRENGFVSVLLNNTKSQLDSFMAALTDYNIQTFSASKKGEGYFVDLIQTGDVKNDIDGIISTTVLGQGNSFKVGNNRNKTNFVVVIGNHSVETVEQFAARIRDAKEVQVFHLVKDDFKSDANVFFNYEKKAEELTTLANKNATFFNDKADNFGGYYSTDQMDMLNKIDETYINFNGVKYEVDHLIISNSIYNYETYVSNANVDYLEQKIKGFNYTFNGVQFDTEELTDEEVDTINNAVKVTKENRKEYINSIVDTVKKEGLEYNKEVLKNPSKLDNVENNIRFRLDYIYKYESDADKVFDIYDEVAKNDKTWGVFVNRILIDKILTDSCIAKRSDRLIVDKMYNVFNAGDTFNAEELNEKVNNLIKELLPNSKKLSKTKTTQLIKLFFDVSSSRTKIDGKDVRLYTIDGKFNLPIDINVDKLNFPDYSEKQVETKKEYKINFGLFA